MRAVGPEPGRGAHDGDGRAAAAGHVPAAVVEGIALVLGQQAVGVEAGDVVDDDLVEGGGAGRVEVVRQVGARDQQRRQPRARLDEGLGQRLDGRAFLVPEEQGHDGDVGQHLLQERKLHLQRVLAVVGGRMGADDRRGEEPVGHAGLDLDPPERRLERAGRPDRHPLEAVIVGRADEDNDVAGSARHRAVGVGRDGAGVDEPGVRGDHGDDVARRSRLCLSQVPVDRRPQRPRVARIPGPGYRGRADRIGRLQTHRNVEPAGWLPSADGSTPCLAEPPLMATLRVTAWPRFE